MNPQSICKALICLIIASLGVGLSCAASDLPTAVVVGSREYSQQFVETLSSAGYSTSVISPDSIQKTDKPDASQYDLMLFTDASRLPVDTIAPLTGYMKSGGNVIALNGPMWGTALIKIGKGNVTVDEYRKSDAGANPDHTVVDFTPESIEGWGRSTNTPGNITTQETIADGPAPGKRALHVKISNLEGWDTFGSLDLTDPFPHGNTLTVFYAKGGPNTTQGYIEWVEKDGSRWVGVFPLYEEWRMYVLTPEDFVFWQSNPARGFKGDKFNPANAQRISMGLSFSFTGTAFGSHEYWIGPIGTDSMKDEYRQLVESRYLPVADTLSPSYKYFSTEDAASLSIRTDQSIIASAVLPMSSRIKSSYARPRGVGFNKAKGWRWIPLIEAKSDKDEWRGNPAVMIINADGDYKGSIWASFGIEDSEWYKKNETLLMIKQIAERMKEPRFIIDGGSNCFTYFKGQEMTLGARIADTRGIASSSIVRMTVSDTASGKQAFRKEWTMNLTPNEIKSVSQTWKPDSFPIKGFTIKTELVSDGKVIDSISHEAFVYQPKKKPQFVKIKDGEFMLNGKVWRPNGTNYMPSSGSAMEDGVIFGTWLSAKAYDPEVIERDIRNMKAMGLNAVTVFLFYDDLKTQNLVDLLRRLDLHDMKANVSLRPGTPMDFPWAMTKEMIEYSQLVGNDTVFAYDLAWEPMFGGQLDRSYWDDKWAKWIIDHYGSIENAEKDWRYPVPRKADGAITNPNAAQVGSDGEWRIMVAAYRRFLDTLLYTKYGRARDLVHSIDPNHFVSFRMAEASNPEYAWGENIPYEFPYLASAVDFLSPEAYGRVGNWERVKPGWFQREYARIYAPDKPMIWAEMGVSTWDNGQMRPSAKLLDFQGQYFSDFYRMMISSGANGFFSWFFPGGYRYDEKSDFGIINPDGTDKPVTKAIREMGPKFINAAAPSGKEIWFEIDRDKNATGLAGTYNDVSRKFWVAIDKGLIPRLKTAGTGTTSANCPLLAVGNTPCNGSNPPKYLDGAFDMVEIMNRYGKWVPMDVENSNYVYVEYGKPVKARIHVRNLGEAKWLSMPGAGQVSLSIYDRVILYPTGIHGNSTYDNGDSSYFSDSKMSYLPIKNNVGNHETIMFDDVIISSGIKSPTAVILSFDAKDRTPFGQKFRVVLDITK